MKLSFDDDHRQAMSHLGALQGLSELLHLDQLSHGSLCDDAQCTTLRRYASMTLTNLTFGHGPNKTLLCSTRPLLAVLSHQLASPNDDLRQVIGFSPSFKNQIFVFFNSLFRSCCNRLQLACCAISLGAPTVPAKRHYSRPMLSSRSSPCLWRRTESRRSNRCSPPCGTCRPTRAATRPPSAPLRDLSNSLYAL